MAAFHGYRRRYPHLLPVIVTGVFLTSLVQMLTIVLMKQTPAAPRVGRRGLNQHTDHSTHREQVGVRGRVMGVEEVYNAQILDDRNQYIDGKSSKQVGSAEVAATKTQKIFIEEKQRQQISHRDVRTLNEEGNQIGHVTRILNEEDKQIDLETQPPNLAAQLSAADRELNDIRDKLENRLAFLRAENITSFGTVVRSRGDGDLEENQNSEETEETEESEDELHEQTEEEEREWETDEVADVDISEKYYSTERKSEEGIDTSSELVKRPGKVMTQINNKFMPSLLANGKLVKTERLSEPKIEQVTVAMTEKKPPFAGQYRPLNIGYVAGPDRHLNEGSIVGQDGHLRAAGEVTQGIYWSDNVERHIPSGIPISKQDVWISEVRRHDITSLSGATWNRCGRQQNGFATQTWGDLAGGNLASMCVRYRRPHQHLVMGESLSYWLSRLLSMDCVPPTVLSNVSDNQWSLVNDAKSKLNWTSGTTVALNMWMPGIDQTQRSNTRMPGPILKAYKTGIPVTPATFSGNDAKVVGSAGEDVWSMEDIVAAAQWSTLLVFDYVTGNYDRVSSMQDGALQEGNPEVVEENIRNLRRSRNSTKLWLIDNESGLLDSYTLMYDKNDGMKYRWFHTTMLRTVCVFQKSLVQAVTSLQQRKSPLETLMTFANENEPLLADMRREVRENIYDLFVKNFASRLSEVSHWMNDCRRQNKS